MSQVSSLARVSVFDEEMFVRIETRVCDALRAHPKNLSEF